MILQGCCFRFVSNLGTLFAMSSDRDSVRSEVAFKRITADSWFLALRSNVDVVSTILAETVPSV